MTTPESGASITPVTNNIIRARLARVVSTREVDDYQELLRDFGNTWVWIDDPNEDPEEAFPLSRHPISGSFIEVGSGPRFGRMFFRVAADHQNNTLDHPQEFDVTHQNLGAFSLNLSGDYIE